MHQCCLPEPHHPPERTSPATRKGVGEHARIRPCPAAKKEGGSLVRGTEESDRAASLALAQAEVRARAILPGSSGPEHQATGALPQPIDTGSASHRLAELTEEKLGRGTRSREDIPLTGLFQQPQAIALKTAQ